MSKIKYLNKKEFKILNNNKKKVLCHGHFDLIHPGHIRFLESAAKKGEELIVAVYDDEYYSSNDLINHYSADQRAKNVASLVYVDKVIIISPFVLHLLLKDINFSYFVLGEEFKYERKHEVKRALNVARKNNINISYHAGEKIYSNEGFKKSQIELKNHRWIQFKNLLNKESINLNSILKTVKKTNKKNIVVVGDVILDKYLTCQPLGMSEEAPLVVVKEIDGTMFTGGAGVVAKHIEKMGNKVELISVLGADNNRRIIEKDLSKSNVKHSFFIDNSRPTTLKTRYIVDNQKIFRVSKLNDKPISTDIEDKIIKKLNLIKQYSILIVSDFVYGVITSRILEAIIKLQKSRKLFIIGDLQCSSQIGDVSKFRNFDVICSTEKEARIAIQDHISGLERVANLLIKKTKAKNLILKLGKDGFITYSILGRKKEIKREHYPALEPFPIDLAGAGDTLLSAIGVAISSKLNITNASAFASCASAISVQKLGNTPINLTEVSDLINQYE
tara:strand:+ start:1690 stop:3198 length:1509 start_codon:yes stop_codon:yes gene_type:complete